MRIGTMFLGKVDEIGPESIQTKFFVLGIPLFPMHSYYVLSETAKGVNGFPLPLHARSVLFGYARTGLAIVLLVTAAISFFGTGSIDYRVFGGLGLVWAWATFLGGRLTRDELRRRQMLGFVTGVNADPRVMPAPVRAEILEKLRTRWASLSLELGATDWREVVESGKVPPGLGGFFYALARYSHAVEGGDRLSALADRAAANP